MPSTTYDRQCNGKRRYESLTEAKKDAKRIARSRKEGGRGTDLHAYQCQFCAGVHLGTEGRYTREERVAMDRADSGRA